MVGKRVSKPRYIFVKTFAIFCDKEFTLNITFFLTDQATKFRPGVCADADP
jgi:hypothetical protein